MKFNLLSQTIGEDEPIGDLEGRTLTIISDHCIILNVYTPNAGSDLKRLEYRTKVWDVKFSEYIQYLRSQYPEKVIIVTGDLNVAHEDIDHFNSDNPKSKLQAGTTTQEKESFKSNVLIKSNLIDTFREFYPNERTYSYFSPRKGELGRKNNEGWRLDYVLANIPSTRSTEWKTIVSNPFIEDKLNHPYSDHCPVGATFHFND